MIIMMAKETVAKTMETIMNGEMRWGQRNENGERGGGVSLIIFGFVYVVL